MKRITTFIFLFLSIIPVFLSGKTHSKSISPDLFGIFFEDINYAADGGLYGELIQNRSFEYNPADHFGWHPFSNWEYITWGYSYGKVSVETDEPLNENNPHYVTLTIENANKEGIGLKNNGFDGIVIKKGEVYNFTVFIRLISENPIPVQVKIFDNKGKDLGVTTFEANSKNWKKYSYAITATESCDSASISVVARANGKLAIDMVSLFPQNTFKNRTNGLRADLAQTIADLQPKFIRFPGGCLVHGDGLGNMYRWKNTIGPVEERIEQKNIWSYHQTVGLGYFEYFQFCEDIGAKPLPVVPAAVSCQNSGGTWRIGGTGQKGIQLNEMDEYIQEILDLIEWANGPETSKWGAKRAAAGHPKSFNLEYIGIGNEDKITPEFETRFKQIYNVITAKHPEIKVIGTVGPAPKGEDYDNGWKIARDLKIPIVDEHYYESPEWFITNQSRYDTYKRSESKVYLGEFASRGNSMFNALAEAAYMTALERNGDVVTLSSYAPLLAKTGHTQWNPDLIYFNNTEVCPTVNYYVQQLFMKNSGDKYYENIFKTTGDSLLSYSCVSDSKTKDLILKIVNISDQNKSVKVDLSKFAEISSKAIFTSFSGERNSKNNFHSSENIFPVSKEVQLKKKTVIEVLPYSLTVIRINQ